MRYLDFRNCLYPTINTYHDERGENLISEVELPGVKKKDISIEAGEEGFCLKAKRGDMMFDSCFEYAHRVDSQKIKADFNEGLLKLKVPLSKKALHERKIHLS